MTQRPSELVRDELPNLELDEPVTGQAHVWTISRRR